jgi:ATP-binding cassette subfamily C protein
VGDSLRLLLTFARAYRWRTAVMITCLLLAGLAEGIGLSTLLPLIGIAADRGGGATPAATSGFQGTVVHAIRAAGLEPSMGALLSIIVAGMIVKAALVLLANKQVGYAVAHVATDLRLGLIRALLRTRWQYYIHQPVGAFANAVASEARRASESYLHAATLLSLAMETVVYAAIACLVSWRSSAAALLAGTVIVYALGRLVRMARRAGAKQTRLAKSLLGRLTDTLQGVKPLKAMAREMLVGPLLEKETRDLNRALEREVLSKEALNALQEPLIVVFLACGLYFALTRTALELPTLIMLALLCAHIIAHLGKVQKEVQKMAACESAFWSLRAMIVEAEGAHEVRSGQAIPELTRGIELRGVSFAYEDRWVLRDADVEVPEGGLTVLVGPSGAGKTTVADLIIGLIEPQNGEVLIDGTPLEAIDARAWRSRIGYVPQETFLLHETIRINVALGDPDLGDGDVEAALRAAGAWEFVSVLPEGMETPVGERGLRMSGGQRQRIALARALARRPKLLVLDEATTGLDPATEESICATLRELRGAMTILAIAHHGSLVEIADRVYRVERGSITALPPREKAPAGPSRDGRRDGVSGRAAPVERMLEGTLARKLRDG